MGDTESGTEKFSIQGCGASHYLLERSRIVAAPEKERNYHIFYELLRSGDAAKYKLEGDPAVYNFTKLGVNETPPGVDDKADFHELVKKMEKGGFDEATRQGIFESVAAVLLLGNVEIKGDQSSCKVVKNKFLTDACALLGISEDSLSDNMTHSFLKTKDNIIKRDTGVQKAYAARDSVVKIVYSRMFDFIITTVDRNLRAGVGADGTAEPNSIGILDIFGFEDMHINGFEQMFINLANERIQHLFNTIMFEREKLTYEAEGISSDFLKCPDNLKCVQMFTSPTRPKGIVGLLSEACADVKDADKVDGEHFVKTLNQAWGKAEHFITMDFKSVNTVMKSKGLKKGASLDVDWQCCFGVKHYAGTIMYTVKDFVPKSANSVIPELETVLRSSTKPVIKNFLDVESGTATTVGQAFTEQLGSLAEQLDSGDTLFVRCIKSNSLQQPMTLYRGEVLHQLVQGGVVAALEMRQAGLPYHLSYAEFREEFGILERGQRDPSDKVACQSILRDLRGKEDEERHQFKFGTTRVFMKSELHNLLHAICRFKMNYYASRISRKLCNNRMRKVVKNWEKLLSAKSEANEHGLEDLKVTLSKDFAVKFKKGEQVTVGQLLTAAQEYVEPVKNAFEASKAKNGGDMTVVAEEMQPHMQAISGMNSISSFVEEVIATFVERQRQVKNAVCVRVNRALATLAEQLVMISNVDEECDACAGADPVDVENCKKACQAARSKVESLKTTEVPSLLNKKFDYSKIALDGPGPFKVPDPCPQIDGMLESGTQLVEAAKKMVYEVLKVRRAFQEALAELKESNAQHEAVLDDVRGDIQAFLQADMSDIVAQITAADKMLVRLDSLEEACNDADGYRALSAKFVEKVVEAKAAVEAGKEELARREAERESRMNLSDELSHLMDQLKDEAGKMKEKAEMFFSDDSQKVVEDVAKCQNDYLPKIISLRKVSWSMPLEQFESESRDVIDSCSSLMAEARGKLDAMQDQNKQKFAERMAAFKK